MLRIGVVAVHYYPDYVPRALAAVDSIVTASDAACCIVVSNNPKILPRLQQLSAGRPHIKGVLQHDNSGLEFGAYQAGVEYLVRVHEVDWIVVVNDTFAVHDCFVSAYRNNLIAAMRVDDGTPSVVGKVEFHPRSYSLEGIRIYRWMTSSVFALNRAALTAIDCHLYSPALDRLVRDATSMECFFAPDLDPIIRHRLSTWLFGLGALPHWYGAAPLSELSAPRLARKARCILQEQYLFGRLDAASVAFIDIRKLTRIQKASRLLEQFLFRYRPRLRPTLR